MVDALEQIHHALVSGGCLVDLRPYRTAQDLQATLPHVYCVLKGGKRLVGILEERITDDLAADRALRQVVRRRLFALQTTQTFAFHTYFRSLAVFDKVRADTGFSSPRTWGSAIFRPSSRARLEDAVSELPGARILIVERVVMRVLFSVRRRAHLEP